MDASFQQQVEIREDGVNCDINIGQNPRQIHWVGVLLIVPSGGTGLTIIWVMVVFAMAIVGTRLYTQARITKQFGLSDYLMLCSIAVITGFASLISVQYQYGWGRHQSCITSLQELETQIKYNVAGQSFGIMGSTFGRLSFIVFMLALFGSKKWVWWSLWAMFLAQIVTNVGTVIVIYAQCKDPRALYTFTLPQDLCWPSYVQTVSAPCGACPISHPVVADICWFGLHSTWAGRTHHSTDYVIYFSRFFQQRWSGN